MSVTPVALAIVSALLALAVALGPAEAQEAPGEDLGEKEAAALDCADFATQTGAQAVFERSPIAADGDPFELDADGDGQACEATPGGATEDGTDLGAQDGEDLDCVDLPSQAVAQDRLKTDPSDPHGLDPENNGVACELVPVPYTDRALDLEPVAATRSTADVDCEDFEYQQEAQAVYLLDPSDPNGLDGPNEPAEDIEQFVGNGVACESMPSLASNAEYIMGKDAGAAGAAPAGAALAPSEPYAAWLRGGLLMDLAALLLVVGGVSALLVVRRGRRSSSSGTGR